MHILLYYKYILNYIQIYTLLLMYNCLLWGQHPTTVLLTYCQTFILYVCLYVVCVCVSFNSCSSSCILCIIIMLPRLLDTICVFVCALI